MTLEELQAELETDPMSYGYASMTDSEAAAAINRARAEIVFPRPDVSPLEILEAINISDFLTDKTNLWAAWFESLTQFQTIRILKANGSDTRTLTNIMKLLTNGSASETRVRELASRKGSRAEQLWGMGTVISIQQIAGARGR